MYKGGEKMPLYDFQCSDCNAVFERLIKKQEDIGKVNCPSCGSKDVMKRFSSCAVKVGFNFTRSASSNTTSNK